MQSQLQVILPLTNFESDRMTPHTHGLATIMTVSKWQPPKSLFFQDKFLQYSEHLQRIKLWRVGKLNVYVLQAKTKKSNNTFWSDLVLIQPYLLSSITKHVVVIQINEKTYPISTRNDGKSSNFS